jgi:hypothetical protein
MVGVVPGVILVMAVALAPVLLALLVVVLVAVVELGTLLLSPQT